MFVTNLTAHCFVLAAGVVIAPNAVAVAVADGSYQADSTLNAQIDALQASGFVTVTGKPVDTFPTSFGAWQRFVTLLELDPVTHILPGWEHDFGGVTPMFLSARLLAVDSDGETLGVTSDDISITVPFNLEGQRDDDPDVPGWTTLGPLWKVQSLSETDQFDTVGQYAAQTTIVPQCVRVAASPLADGTGLGTYAGTHHPTATVELVVEWPRAAA